MQWFSNLPCRVCLPYHCQVGPDNVETRTFLDLFAHLASDHVFNELRTKEQLGGSGPAAALVQSR